MRKRPEKFEDILGRKYRWPKKGDRLLRRSGDWNRGVVLSAEPISKLSVLIAGYFSAADGLLELAAQQGYEHERHFVIFPILYNYRHGLELAMKWTIVMYGGDGLEGIEGVEHDLWELWKRCRAILNKYGSTDNEADAAVGQIVKDFHDLDKAGVAFRYGWGKNRKEIKLPDGPIDLANIRDVMEGVADYFNGLDGWLSDLSFAGP